MEPLIEIENLSIGFKTRRGFVRAVDGVDMRIKRKESVALVGESGCGKSTLVRAIPRIFPPSARILSGKIFFKGQNLLHISDSELRKIRGMEIGMIFQDPMTYLNPVMKVGDQISEKIIYHNKIDKKKARVRAVKALREMILPNPEVLYERHPHELSGGMRQRIMISMALSGCNSLLIADEPTTSVDVTTQLEILQLMKQLQNKRGISLLFVTHDLTIVGTISDRTYVMYAGKIVEAGETRDIFLKPKHPYTTALLRSNATMVDHKEKYYIIKGTVPDLIDPPSGCRFHPRCPHVMKICSEKEPPNFSVNGQRVACLLYEETHN